MSNSSAEDITRSDDSENSIDSGTCTNGSEDNSLKRSHKVQLVQLLRVNNANRNKNSDEDSKAGRLPHQPCKSKRRSLFTIVKGKNRIKNKVKYNY